MENVTKFDNILDLMGGVGGGVPFIKFKFFIDSVVKTDTEDARKMLEALKLIDKTCKYFINEK